MEKPAHLWVTVAPDVRALVPRNGAAWPSSRGGVAIHVSSCCQGAELAGPWLLRAAVRVPVAGADGTSPPDRSRWLGALHVRWLRHMGVRGADVYEGPASSHWCSFGARRAGDVVVGNQKIVSVVELRRAHDVLLVASTLLHPAPWSVLCNVVERPGAEAVAIDDASVCASSVLASTLDAQAWAANLRSMLHLSLMLSELRDGTVEA